MPWLLDGYNLYHAARKYHPDWTDLQVNQLCEMVHADMTRLKERAEIVFDGVCPRGRPERIGSASHLEIIYSGGHSDADTLMEQYIQENTAPRRLTVVSSDRRLQRAARRRRARTLAAQEYLAALLERQSAQRRRPPDPREKRAGLADGELTGWLDLFGIDDGPDDPDDLHDLIR